MARDEIEPIDAQDHGRNDDCLLHPETHSDAGVRAGADGRANARQAVDHLGGHDDAQRTRDPQTGDGLDAARIRANVMTFMGTGYETTYSNLT